MPRNKSENRQNQMRQDNNNNNNKNNKRGRNKRLKNERVKTGWGKGVAKRREGAWQYKLRVKSPKRDKCHCVLGAQSRAERSVMARPACQTDVR